MTLIKFYNNFNKISEIKENNKSKNDYPNFKQNLME